MGADGVSQGTRVMRMRQLLASLAALLLVAPGPTAAQAPLSPPLTPTPTASPSSLEDGTWELTQYLTAAGYKEVVSDSGRAYAQFGKGRFRMNAGCGTLRGSYMLEGTRLLFSPHVSSMLGDCPQVLASQEQTLIALLYRVARIDSLAPIEGETPGLALLDDGGETLVTLQAPDAVPLQGRRWRLIAYRDRDAMIRPALPEPVFTLWFEDATNLAGVACDRYSASFTREDRFLRLQGPVATSRFGCTRSAAARQQGDAYIDALSQMEAYRVDGDTLLVRDRDGRMLARFQPLEAEQQRGERPDTGLADGAVGRPGDGFAPEAFDLGRGMQSREP